jgi:protein-tyrosine phosphatase
MHLPIIFSPNVTPPIPSKMSASMDTSRILPNLWVCNLDSLAPLTTVLYDSLELIVSVTKSPVSKRGGISHIYLKIDDDERENEKFLDSIDTIVSLMYRVLSRGKRVIVHCNAGVSRSCSVIAAYLMKYEGYGLRSAIDRIRTVRPKAFSYGIYVVFDEALRKFHDRITFGRIPDTEDTISLGSGGCVYAASVLDIMRERDFLME